MSLALLIVALISSTAFASGPGNATRTTAELELYAETESVEPVEDQYDAYYAAEREAIGRDLDRVLATVSAHVAAHREALRIQPFDESLPRCDEGTRSPCNLELDADPPDDWPSGAIYARLRVSVPSAPPPDVAEPLREGFTAGLRGEAPAPPAGGPPWGAIAGGGFAVVAIGAWLLLRRRA